MARQSNSDKLSQYRQKIELSQKVLQQQNYIQLWQRLINLYRGRQYRGVATGDRLLVNIAFSTINTLAPAVSIGRPKIMVNPRKPEDGDKAVVTESIINYWWQHYGCQPEFQRAVKDYLIIGHGWVKTGYRFVEEKKLDDIQDTDYQLARSLIAFGRGEFTGVGYGESVQKLSHLPEAHTDFLLAITGEELGFVGVATVLLLEALIIASAMRISYSALQRRQMRLSYTAFGIGVIFIGQTIINAAMNMGAMPTKGLTMPFFSYGGSSMLISLVMVALLLRIYKEGPLIEKSQCRYY